MLLYRLRGIYYNIRAMFITCQKLLITILNYLLSTHKFAAHGTLEIRPIYCPVGNTVKYGEYIFIMWYINVFIYYPSFFNKNIDFLYIRVSVAVSVSSSQKYEVQKNHNKWLGIP